MKEPVMDAVTCVLATAAELRSELDAIYRQFALTSTAFTVLSILRDAPGGYPRRSIAQRLISRAPDVTRLIDRLERQGFVKRGRAKADRRLSVTKITPKGAALVAKAEPVLEEFRARIAAKLAPAEWHELSRLCERLEGVGDASVAQG